MEAICTWDLLLSSFHLMLPDLKAKKGIWEKEANFAEWGRFKQWRQKQFLLERPAVHPLSIPQRLNTRRRNPSVTSEHLAMVSCSPSRGPVVVLVLNQYSLGRFMFTSFPKDSQPEHLYIFIITFIGSPSYHRATQSILLESSCKVS